MRKEYYTDKKGRVRNLRAHGKLPLSPEQFNPDTLSELVKRIWKKYPNITYLNITPSEINWTFEEEYENLIGEKEKKNPSRRS